MKTKTQVAAEGFHSFLKKIRAMGVDSDTAVGAMRQVLGEIESRKTFDVAPTKDLFTLPHAYVAVDDTDYHLMVDFVRRIATTTLADNDLHGLIQRIEAGETTTFAFPQYASQSILSEEEQKVILTNPVMISALMDYHSLQQDQAESVGMETKGNQTRYDELKRLGFDIVMQDPDIWPVECHKTFGLEDE